MNNPSEPRLLLSRRGFLLTTGFGLVSMPLWLRFRFPWQATDERFFLTSYNDPQDKSFIAAVDIEGRMHRSIAVGTRCHGIAISPALPSQAVVFPRRPGYTAYHVDFRTGEVLKEFNCSEGRFFYGHGCFSKDGRYLFATENDYVNGRGVMSVRDGRTMQLLGEVPTFGIGPHEVTMLGDGRTLVIANGGVLEKPESGGREKLNVESMQPSLVYVDAYDRKLLGEFRADNHYLGMRHISVRDDGLVAIAIQNEGPPDRPTPLVGFHRGNEKIVLADAPEDVLRSMKHFALSVCMHPGTGITAVSCPKGNLVTFWDGERAAFIRSFPITDASGITLSHDGESFVITSGVGDIYLFRVATIRSDAPQVVKTNGIKWDNHVSIPLTV